LHFSYSNIHPTAVLALVRASLYSSSMSENSGGENGKQLLELAQERGYSVSTMQLARWHRAGLLPRPLQRSLGRGLGTQSLYPVGTGEQLLLLCELRKHERRLAQLAWQIWWEGYPVDLGLIREILQKTTARLSERIRQLVAIKHAEQVSDDKTLEETEELLDFIEQFATVHLGYKPLRRVRKRLGKEQFSTFMRMLIDIASGTFTGYSTTYDRREVLTELRILAKALGQNELFLKDDGNIEHYIEKLLVPYLHEVSLWLQTLPWEQALQDATHFDLQQARDEIRVLSTQFSNSGEAMMKMRDYPVWGNAWQKNFPAVTIEDEEILLVMQLALRAALSAASKTPFSS
jgi:hypothetical protein